MGRELNEYENAVKHTILLDKNLIADLLNSFSQIELNPITDVKTDLYYVFKNKLRQYLVDKFKGNLSIIECHKIDYDNLVLEHKENLVFFDFNENSGHWEAWIIS